jgi:hypothetical protein
VILRRYLEIADCDRLSSLVCTFTSRECADTCHELTIVTGLPKIVICTIVESRHDIISCTTRGEHDDRSSLSLAPKSTADLDAIHPRELDIEYDDVIIPIDRFHIPIGSYGSEGTADILTCEVASDSLSKGDVIFDK